MFLSNISIARRLAIVLGVILALFLASSAVSALKLRQLGVEITGMVEDNVRTERAGADWLRNTTSGVQRAAAIAKSSDAGLVAYFAPATAASIKETNELQKFIEEQMTQPEERALFQKVGELRKDYLAAREEVSKLKLAGDLEGAERVFSARFEPTSVNYLAGVKQMVDLQRAGLDAAAQRAEDLRAQTTTLLVVCSALSLIFGSLAGLVPGAQHHASAAPRGDHGPVDRRHGPDRHAAIELCQRRNRPAPARHRHDAHGPAEVAAPGAGRGGERLDGVQPDRIGQPGPFIAHRGAGQLAGADGSLDGRTHQHGEAERGQRAPGESAGAVGLRSGCEGRRRGEPGGRHHGLHQCVVQEDRRHHRRDRRHRVPDQHPGAERSRGSGARRRAGPRLRGGGRRSAQPGAALGRSGQGDQGPDRRLGGQGRRGQRTCRRSRQDDGRDRGQREAGDRHHRRDHGGEPRAERRASSRSTRRSRRWTR